MLLRASAEAARCTLHDRCVPPSCGPQRSQAGRPNGPRAGWCSMRIAVPTRACRAWQTCGGALASCWQRTLGDVADRCATGSGRWQLRGLCWHARMVMDMQCTACVCCGGLPLVPSGLSVPSVRFMSTYYTLLIGDMTFDTHDRLAHSEDPGHAFQAPQAARAARQPRARMALKTRIRVFIGSSVVKRYIIVFAWRRPAPP